MNGSAQRELIELYHLSLTALASLPHVPTRHDRLSWAAEAYAKEHGIKTITAYKELSSILD